MRIINSLHTLLLVVVIPLAGCGGSDRPPLYPVTGTVTYEGKPLAEATVTLIPETGLVAVGRTDNSGQFSLKTQGNEGAVDGPARIVVTAFKQLKTVKPEDVENMTDAERRKLSESLIPAKYGNPEFSGLSANISKDQPNDITIELLK